MAMTSQFPDITFFWSCLVFPVQFSYWLNFHVNIITGSGVMTISFYKGLSRNPDIRNTPFWVLLNIWRLGRVRNTKFGTNVSNKMLLNDAKCQVYGFYHFWVIGGGANRVGEGGRQLAPHIQSQLVTKYLRLTANSSFHVK